MGHVVGQLGCTSVRGGFLRVDLHRRPRASFFRHFSYLRLTNVVNIRHTPRGSKQLHSRKKNPRDGNATGIVLTQNCQILTKLDKLHRLSIYPEIFFLKTRI